MEEKELEQNSQKKKGFVRKSVEKNVDLTKKVLNTESHIANYELGKRAIKSLFKRPEKRNETWEESIERFNSTDESVKLVYNQLLMNFYIVGIGFIVCLGLITFYLASKNIGATLSSFSIGVVLLVLMFKNSFKCYQIRNKSWQIGFKEYFDNFQEWLPAKLDEKYTIKGSK